MKIDILIPKNIKNLESLILQKVSYIIEKYKFELMDDEITISNIEKELVSILQSLNKSITIENLIFLDNQHLSFNIKI